MPQGIISIEDLLSGEEEQVDEESTIGKFKKKQEEINLKDLERTTKTNAQIHGMPYVYLFRFPISPEALSLIPEKEAEENRVVCFYYDGENIRLGTTNPGPNVDELLEKLSKKYHCQGKIYFISPYSLKYALDFYKALPKIIRIEGGVEIKSEDLIKFKNEIKNFKNLNEKIKEVNISDIVTLILATAMHVNASDVHIEAEEHGIVVRLRIDGVLQEAAVIDKEKWRKVISRMKLLAKVKINITDKPQDGRYTIFLKDNKIDVRSSFLPTAYGESVVMRLLQSNTVALGLDGLGIRPESLDILKKEIEKPNGMILTTGPTGSGKTTTLYAILHKLNNSETKIITLEDPIEYKLKGVNQSQVDHKKGYDFATGLKSILRQDPDIVMVGEIRDLETAQIATQASLTGHLVLSTLHTNDASGVIPRLLDIGIKPYFLIPSINAVIGQRLIRKLCPFCKIKHELTKEDDELVKRILSVISPKAGIDVPNELPTIYKTGEGCPKCNWLGYKGRIGIYEIFTMNEKIKELTLNQQPAFKILQQAIEDGMITMLQDGVLKCLEGLSSLEEVYRVIGKFEYIDALYDIVISRTINRGLVISEENIQISKDLSKNILGMNEKLLHIPTKNIVGLMLATAIEFNAGDIHIEPSDQNVQIRFRIDGILHDVAILPKNNYLPLLSEIKILAGFPTNVKRAAWDGRFSIRLPQEKIDCRISIISGGYGETVVIRLLNNQASALEMETLGLEPYALIPIKKSISATKGIVITTGPTGSGKTTTLYSLLNKINHPDIKIITIEDPIEYHMDGIMQTQIDTEQGYTFAEALKSLLRQNPNVIMIGEIRDTETAKVAIESSLTGHLVFSTIHANSAAGAIPRFMGLGIDKEMLINSINCTIGQRLVRKICPKCKTETKLDEYLINEVNNILKTINPKSGIEIPKQFTFYKGKGCEYCGGIGYRGRIGIYEVIEMLPGIQEALKGVSVSNNDIEQAAMNEGTILMLQDGILKALKGETTVEEVFRVAK